MEIFRYMRDRGVSFPVTQQTLPEWETPRKGRFAPEDTAEEKWYFQDYAPVVLVLELRLTGNCGYYFVDHAGQRLFWLEDYDFSWAAGEVHVGHSDSIIGMEMKRHYWRHNEYFPHLYEFTEKDLEEMDDMITFTFGGMCSHC